MKSEPDDYSIDDLAKDGRAQWDGIRNCQARNMMRDDMILTRKGNRLSLMPVGKKHWNKVLSLE